jgi:WD repeat-containing protein 35
MRLREYDDVLRPFDAAAVLALCAYYAKAFGQCSRAFIVLEALDDQGAARQKQIETTALSIFVRCDRCLRVCL